MFVSYVFADFFCNQATNTVTRSATQPCSACASCGAGQSGHSPLLATIAATGDGEPVLWLLTVGANASAGQAMSRRPLHAGILGLARSARLEAPAARIGYIDLYANPSNLAAVISIFTTLNNSAERRPPPNETEVLHHDASACFKGVSTKIRIWLGFWGKMCIDYACCTQSFLYTPHAYCI